jgi:hypothetical protein
MDTSATCFKACWDEYARKKFLPADPDAPMPRRTVAQARREALEFFSWGLVHGERERRRYAEILPMADERPPLRIVNGG